MFKRLFLLFFLLSLFYLSSTSQILVSDPSTWSNSQIRESSTDLSQLWQDDSVFFDTYFEEGKTIDDLNFEFYIRKFLHLSAYAFLSLLIFWNLPKKWFRLPLSFVLTVTISFLDEANQFTTYGRSGRLWDVYLDSTAALFALSILGAIRLIIFFNKKIDK